MSILSSAEIAQIRSTVANIIGDGSISTSITYYLSGTTAEEHFDPQDQEIFDLYSQSSVSAFKGGYSTDEVAESGGLIQYGDVKFIITTSSVSGVLSGIDWIAERASTEQSATTYNVIQIVRDPLSIAYFIQCRAC